MSSEEEMLSLEQVNKVEPVIRELIRHENDVLHQRLTWLIQSQGLLFTALAFAWEKEPRFALLLSILGIATCLSIGSAISLYSPAVRGLHNWWETNVPDKYKKGRLVMGLWTPSEGVPRIFRPWRALPFIFILAWLGVFVLKRI